jgi:hypothetical protein
VGILLRSVSGAPEGGPMYALVRSLETRAALAREMLALTAALVVAELAYKFHSFTLECLAFLATWALFSGTIAAGAQVFGQTGRTGHGV